MKNVLLSLACATALASSASAANISLVNVSGGRISEGFYSPGVEGTNAGLNNWPAAEAPPSATDGIVGNGNKYLNFAEFDTGFVVNTTGGPDASLILTGLTFATGNDAPERDPLTFTLYGSSTLLGPGGISLSTLTLIVANAPTGLLTDPGRNTFAVLQTFSNNAAYAGYLLYFPTVRDSATANSMQISEITFSGVPEPGTFALSGLALLGFLRRRR